MKNTRQLTASIREERTLSTVTRTILYDKREIVFEVSGPVLPPSLELYDFAALALIFPAMRLRQALHIDGPVSVELIRNLEDFQEAWAAWRRSRYSPVPVTASEIRSAAVPVVAQRTGVFAFSGGVDGTFALLRHLNEKAGFRTILPVTAVLVHGFDIPLREVAAFQAAHEAAAAIMEHLRLPLCTLRTNWRKVACEDWEMEFGAGLAACLHQFTGAVSHGVLGADEDYAHLSLPWGSNPLTNTFLTGGSFEIRTEGSGMTRTQRVALICDTPEVAQRLRVCWEGPITGGNCGICEKCIRTKMNFLANGQDPLCFDRPPTPSEVLRVRARNPVQVAYLEDIKHVAEANGISAPWITALTIGLAKNRAMNSLRPAVRRSKTIARRLIGR